MPTPVGHALGGLAVYLAARGRIRRGDRALVVAVVFSALLPDLDFAIGPFVGRSYHHYFTHSLGFAALFFGASYPCARALGSTKPLRHTAIVGATYLSHLLLDLLAKDTAPPFGIELLWPWSDAFYLSPVTIFTDIWRGNPAKLFGLHNWMAVGLEVLILLPVVMLLWRLPRSSGGQLE